MKNTNLKLAIQKNGRLTEDAVSFLRSAGLQFENYKQKLFSSCRNFPLEIVYVRDDDIPDYVESGAVDLGIVGQNILNESNKNVSNIINLNFGICSLSIAIPENSNINVVEQLINARIFTSYPNSTKKYFIKKNIPVNIMAVSGSVEITPALGIADAIVDLVSTGRTLALNNLKIFEKIYDSQATLIVGKDTNLSDEKKILMQKLIKRFKKLIV
ncbi:ATP phosphoribosyltransferase [Candidatus Roizmanbacteria bacterium]|nr:ATP phosphoribosyltransferase [Candidatus Roizmanbacteria bacterium]